MTQDLEKRVSLLSFQAQEMGIQNEQDLSSANQFLLGVKSLQKEINETFDPMVKATNEAHMKAVAQKKKFQDPLILAERMVKPKITAYLTEQERIRHEQERAAREAQEAKRRVDDALRKAEEAEDKEMMDAMAAHLDEAMEIDAASPTEPVTVSPPPKTVGLSMREDWDFEIVDAALIPRAYLLPDLPRIRHEVRASKGKIEIPGVRPFAKTVLSARA